MRGSALTVIHKVIRQELFDVTRQLACAGAEEIDDARRAIGAAATLLRGHAEHEDASLEPMLREVDPALAERLAADHARLEEALEALCDAAGALEPGGGDGPLRRLYLDWTRFVGEFLLHLDDEERTMLPALGAAVPGVAMVAESARGLGAAERDSFLGKLRGAVSPAELDLIERALAR